MVVFIMTKLHTDQHGSHVLPVLVIMATIAVVIFVGYTVFTKNKQLHGTQTGSAQSFIAS